MPNVSFFQPKDVELDRKRRLAQALMDQGKQQEGTQMVGNIAVPVSPLSALAKALTQTAGGYFEGQANRAEKQDQDNARQTMANALDAYSRSQAGDTTPLQSGGQIKWNKATPGQSGNLYANILMGNPDTAPYGVQAQMGQLQNSQDLAQAQKLKNIQNQMSPYQQQYLELERQKLKDTPLGPAQSPSPITPKPQSFGPAQPNPAIPTPSMPQAAIQPPANAEQFGPPVSGDAYLRRLDPKLASVVKMIGDNKEKSSTVLSRLPAKEKLQILDAVNHYKPDYSANKFTGLSQFYKGPTSDKIRSLNVSISHINDTLMPAIDALKNGDIKLFNKFANAYSEQTGDPAPTNFDATKQVVSNEIIKAIVNSGGGQQDRQDAQDAINRANSPQQLSGVAQQYTSLLGGQLKGFEQQYKASGGTDFDQTFLTPETRQALSGPKKIMSDDDYDALPSGAEYIDPDGNKRKKQ